VRTLGRELCVGHEAEDAQTIVNGDEYHILGGPLLAVELGLRAPALAIAATVYPQGYGQFLACIAGCLGPYVQIKTVFTVRCLVAIAPF